MSKWARQAVCMVCRVGTYARAGSTACAACAAGKSDHDNDPSSDCVPCPSKTYSRSSHAGTCSQCAKGHAPARNQTACVPCAAGKHTASGDECVACAVGQKPDRTRTRCVGCTGLSHSAAGRQCVACANHSVPNKQRSGCDVCNSLQFAHTWVVISVGKVVVIRRIVLVII